MQKSQIIYLLGAYPQWSETFVRQDLSLLQELELPLCPVALFPGESERQADWPEVRYLDSSPPGAAGAPSALAACSRLLPRYMATRLSLFHHRHRVQALAELARSLGARHIHAEFADLPALVGAAAARRLGLGYSLSVHARDVHVAKFSPGLVYGGARFVLACNRDVWRGVNRYRCAARAGVHLIHHGLDLANWYYREPPPPGDPLRLMFVGRLVEKKGLNVLFRALALLRDKGRQVRLSLYGDGPLEALLRSLGRMLGLEDALVWEGVVPREEIARRMREHDVLVMPSIVTRDGDRDGVPNVVVEAMACGLPVVGSDAGSLPEVLTPETGWPFPAGQESALAAAVEQLLAAPGETSARCQAARQLVISEFDARVLARKRAGLLQTVLEPNPNPL
jgi:glycosyltransferase involved in cell wall biosynthesis